MPNSSTTWGYPALRGGDKPARVFLGSPVAGECIRYLVPSTARMPAAVGSAHTGAFAVETLGIPTRRPALLLLPEQLNDVNLSVLGDEALDEVVEPGDRQLPTVILRIPSGFAPFLAPQEGEVVSPVGKSDQKGAGSFLAKDDRNLAIPPDVAQPRVLLCLISHPALLVVLRHSAL